MMTCYCFDRQNNCRCQRPQGNGNGCGCKHHNQNTSWQGGQGCSGRGNSGGWVSGNHSCANDWRFCKCPRQNTSWGYDNYDDDDYYGY